MKAIVREWFDFQPDIIFRVLTDIPHQTDWLEGPAELVGLHDGPAAAGTRWEQNSNLLGRQLLTLHTCNLYERNKRFGWITENPFQAQITFLLESKAGGTGLTWIIEAETSGLLRLVEPLWSRKTKEMMCRSLVRLTTYLQPHI